MPLSEEEQKILYEIERSFYEQDPEFADKVRSETVYTHAGRHIKWAGAGLLVGFAIILVSFTSNIAIALVGFAIMLVSGVFIQRNFRRMGKAGFSELASAARDKGVTGALERARQGIRQRFQKDT